MYSIRGRGSFSFNYCLNWAWHGGDQFVALLRWYGSPGFFDRGLRVICIVGSGVSSSSWQYPVYYLWGSGLVSCWPIKHSNTMVIEPAFGTFGSVGRCQVLLENEIIISIKCQQKEAWSALKFLVDGCVDCGLQKTQWTNTSRWHGSPNHHWLRKLHTGLQATWILCLSTLPPDSGTLISNEMQNLLSTEKRTLDHWATVQFFFSTAQVRCFWRCLWFRSGLVALFLKTWAWDSWCTDSSFSPLLVKLSQVFESALLDCILKLAVIPVACAPFPTQILPSSQLCI